MVVHTCNPNIHKTRWRQKESGVQTHSQIHSELGASLGYKKLSLKKKKDSKIICVTAELEGDGNGLRVGFLRGPGLLKCDSSGHPTLTSHKNCLQQSINQARMSVPDTAPVSAFQQNDYSLITLLPHLPRTVIRDLWFQCFSYAERGFLICFPQTQKPQSPSLQCCWG